MICYNCKNQLSDATVYDVCPFCGADLRPGAKKTFTPKEAHLEEAIKEAKKVEKTIPFLEIFPLIGIFASIFLFFAYTWWVGVICLLSSVFFVIILSLIHHLKNSLFEMSHYIEKDKVSKSENLKKEEPNGQNQG